jgi:hypothetical protein
LAKSIAILLKYSAKKEMCQNGPQQQRTSIMNESIQFSFNHSFLRTFYKTAPDTPNYLMLLTLTKISNLATLCSIRLFLSTGLFLKTIEVLLLILILNS